MNAVPDLPPSLARTRRHLFLSPHYDDIPLSAGATVRLLADNGLTPETRVVFGSEPNRAQPLTAFAASLHDAWGLSADEVIARRKAEEDAAAAILGARSSVLPFRDAIYRGALYLSDDDLFGTPAAEEAGSLPGAIIDALTLPAQPDSETRLYVPLGVGRHVDHQMVFRTGVELTARGWDVWFYEDVPYALRPNALASRLAEIAETARFEPAADIPAAPGWERKLDAIFSYPSQLETVFRQYIGVGTTRDEIGAALAEFASDAGTGAPVERFWRVSAVVGQINS